jgi:hypothetical protein
MPKNKKINQKISWYVLNGKNENDSDIKIKFNIIKPMNNSKFNTSKHDRIAANIAYLFLLK